MTDFWKLARLLLERRGTLALAMVFVFISAGGLGAGLLTIGPMLQMILGEEGRSLVVLAEEYNAGNPMVPVPQAVIAWLPADRIGGVQLSIGFILVLTVVGGFANFMHQYLSQTLSTRTVARIRSQLFERIVHMPLGRVVQRGPSTLIARLVGDTTALHVGFVSLTRKSVAHITKGLAAFCVALWFDWKLTAAAVVFVPLLGIAMRKIGKRIRRGSRGALWAHEGLLRVATESVQGLRSVKANTAEQQIAGWFDQINEEVVRQELRIRTARAVSGPLMESLAVVVVAAIAIIAARLIIAGAMPFDRFLITIMALAMAGAALRPLTGFLNELQAAAAPAGRIIEVLDEPVETDGDRPDLARHAVSLEFDGLTFAYPGADRPALDDVTLNIMHGERVAIVGPNGSGKTTLLGMVPRLLTPDAGQVRIDGHDVRDVRLRSLRDQIGVVTQETVLFRGTVAENIGLGRPDATREQVIAAARRAHAHGFIEQIPGGYDANVLEQGASLSGGQRQRLAIARAVLRDPAILILDEATSQIDAESEAEINAALDEFCRGRTSLIIAHRLSTVLHAERIFVMDEGRVVDQGTHEQLLARCELYARLTKTQLVVS